MEPKQPTKGPYEFLPGDAERGFITIKHHDGEVADHASINIIDSKGRRLAEVKYSTCHHSADFEGERKPMHCDDYQEFLANSHLFAASWLMREALRACKAWNWAEAQLADVATFEEKMELCQYSEWLTEQALLAASGRDIKEFPDPTYSGVPKLVVWPDVFIHREGQEGAQAIVDRLIYQWDAALLAAEGKVQP